MVRVWLRALGWVLLTPSVLMLHQSSGEALAWPFAPRAVRIETERFEPRGLRTNAPLRFIAAWRLRSPDRGFGGLSALARTEQGFLALSDGQTLASFDLNRRGTLRPLPPGCGGGADKRTRDSESMIVDPDGTLLVGHERRNVICRVGPDGVATLTAPPAMKGWPRNAGAESLVRLRNGAVLAVAERARDNGPDTPAILFGTGGRSEIVKYRPPAGFHPSDAAQLPDGALLVLNRRFDPPLSLPGRLVLIDRFSNGELSGRTIARFEGPDLDQNFEGLAVSQAHGRSFVWLISDDNFMPTQDTLLLLLEYRPRSR